MNHAEPLHCTRCGLTLFEGQPMVDGAHVGCAALAQRELVLASIRRGVGHDSAAGRSHGQGNYNIHR